MEEVEGFLEGERDYTKIRGNTGPLVYPAGFLYVFTVLRYMTNEGKDIFMAQCVFLVLYIMNLAVVLGLYSKSGKIPAFLCLFLTLSKRIHSIFILRMFNDCVAAFLGYCAVLLYCYRQWRVGSLVYSAAVSIKMNMLLYAPGVFVILLLNLGLFETVYCIGLCALFQFVLGAPFLLVHPISYIKKAFELSRVFEYKWTVNYKFLPEAIFLDKRLSIGLLVLTVIG
jgi:alpha-1,3-mannosyltransferase